MNNLFAPISDQIMPPSLSLSHLVRPQVPQPSGSSAAKVVSNSSVCSTFRLVEAPLTQLDFRLSTHAWNCTESQGNPVKNTLLLKDEN